jgi:SAM-dependent methyltransferase
MSDTAVIIFGAINLTKNDVEGKTVIELGALDVNGSLRPIIESLKPSKYIGVDLRIGPGVDITCDVLDIIEKFGKESFDIVVATELIEHIRDWKRIISNIKNICKPAGKILITTRSKGFEFHGFPDDFWRFELVDMQYIFSDCIIEKLESDKYCPGIFIKVRKPEIFNEKNLDDYQLYSIILDKKTKEIDEKSLRNFKNKYFKTIHLKRILETFGKLLFKAGKAFISKF